MKQIVLSFMTIIFLGCTPDNEPDLVFGIIADCQYCNCKTSGTRHYKNSLDKMEEAIDFFNQKKPAFVAHLGDLIDRDFSSYDSVFKVVDNLVVPLKMVLGNHEFSVADSLKASVLERVGLETPYYSFQKGNWRFIVTDGNDIATYSSIDSTIIQKAQSVIDSGRLQRKPNAQPWNGMISERQLQWIDDELSKAGQKGQKAIIFNHFPIAPSAGHNLLNDAKVLKLLESQPSFVAWFNGHNHAGGYHISEEGHHYVTFHGMVETDNTNAYSLVKVFQDSIVIEGQGREVSRVLNH